MQIAYRDGDLWKVRTLYPELAEMLVPIYGPIVGKMLSLGARSGNASMVALMSLVPPLLDVYHQSESDELSKIRDNPVFLEIPIQYKDESGKTII